ncbi:MAG: hypothetical protein ACR2OZ_17170 [Verrucomicrobiales bacterium]
MTFPVPPDFLSAAGDETEKPQADPFGQESPDQTAKKALVTCKDYPNFFQVNTIRDATPILKAAGIPLRENVDIAYFHQPDSSLYVRAPRSAVDLIGQFLESFVDDSEIRLIEVETVIADLQQPLVFAELQQANDPLSAAERMSAEKGGVLARASTITRSGQKSEVGHRNAASNQDNTAAQPRRDDKISAAAAIVPGAGRSATGPVNEAEPGIWLEVEPTLGPDGVRIDLSWTCDFAVAGKERARGTLTRGHIRSVITLISGRASVQRLNAIGASAPDLAVIIGARVRNTQARTLENGVPQLSNLEKSWRALGQSAVTN